MPVYGGVGASISAGFSYIVFFEIRTILSNRYFPMKWDMGKFFVITLMFLAYALYNTFIDFGIMTGLGYIAIFSVLLLCYWDVVQDGWCLIKTYLLKNIGKP